MPVVAQAARQRPVFHERYGQDLKALREAHGWSVQQAVNLAIGKGHRGLTWNKLTWLESGKTKLPDRDTLEAIAAIYELRYEELAEHYIQANYGTEVFRRARGTKKRAAARLAPRTPAISAEERRLLEKWSQLPRELRQQLLTMIDYIAKHGTLPASKEAKSA